MSLMFANNASATLATTLEIGDTALIVNSGEGGMFPLPVDGHYFLVTAQDQTGQLEVMRCTARSADILTVTRGQESTSQKEFLAGTVIEMRVTAGMLDAFMQSDDVDAALEDYDTIAVAEAKYLQESLNLSDLDSALEARDNLGLGTAAVLPLDTWLQVENNLDDLEDPAIARDNLGLGDVATEDVLPVAKGGTGVTTLEDLGDALGIPALLSIGLKAAVLVNNAGAVVRADGCSVSFLSTGRWLVTFTTPYANLNRIMLSLARDSTTAISNSGPQGNYYNLAVGSVEVQMRNGGNNNAFEAVGWSLMAWELSAP